MNTSTALVLFALLFSLESFACDGDIRSASTSGCLDSGTQGDSPWHLAAKKHNVEAVDLCSIALQESRRHRTDGYVRPWPWTLHTPTEGALYFPDYSSALDKLKQLIAKGLRNIDVGLMQVNWGYHNQRVSGPEELLELARNIDVAAEIHRENLDATGGDISRAIARYHSPRPERGEPYAAAVLTIREYLSSAQISACSPQGG